ncbi:hypothetical protein AAFF_G00025050 [Aldrovandia affinis]|uniref:Ig-like domain-containing protein n=1 Tax=Aldrovandia affinis TaxID=143900 RepID=A0AAD7T6X1_9TELE|nr:hypothetical protein AAFF_G00025050 [Aldrovandia affinis]
MAKLGSLTGLEITHGPDNIIVATETEAALHCAVHGFPLPIVHWFRNSQPLQNDSHRSLQNHGQLLFFKNVSEEDEGFYYCEAKNEGETVRSQMAFLLPAVMEWNFVQQPNNETARREESVTLTCRPPYSRPPALVSWFKNNRLINPMPHFSLQPNGDLLFHSVQDKDRGIYFCRASNAHLFRAVSSRKVYLNVLAPPSVEIWPVVVTAALGSEVRFQCQVSGNPIPSITWSKQGWSVLTGGKVTIGIRNTTLYLSSVKSYDEGFYMCDASNAVGHARGTASLHISGRCLSQKQLLSIVTSFKLVQILESTVGIKCLGTVRANQMAGAGAHLKTDKELEKEGVDPLTTDPVME